MLVFRNKQKLKEAELKKPASFNYEKLTKDELKKKLDELNIKYKTNDTKNTLISLLKEGG